MFQKIYLEPENKTFAEVMSNGRRYSIPPFQRDYSWEESQLEELWQDIEQMLTTQMQHFMGYLVFQTDDNKAFHIIDGQQRLTTISLFILAALHAFQQMIKNDNDKENNEKRLTSYHQNYFGVLDTVTLQNSLKLELNRHNNSHFIDMIEQYDVAKTRGMISTNRKLNKAFEFFQKKLKSYLNGEDLAALINKITDGLMFTTITVQDDLNAYLVFETLNTRGVHLSAPDLFKNYLLSTMSKGPHGTDSHIHDFEEEWAEIVEQLGATDFTNFLRSYVGIRDPLPYKKDLYRTLKKRVDSPDKVIPYLKAIKKHAPVYAALQNHQDAFWSEYDDGKYTVGKPHLEVLGLFNITTPLSLLMAAYNHYDAQNFIKILQWIAVISIRYNVICNKSAKEQAIVYNRLANAISARSVPLDTVRQSLRPIYPPDDEFKNAFSCKSMPSRHSSKKNVFLLCQIEKKLSEGYQPSTNVTLEHILPYSPEDAWQESFGAMTYNDAIDRLGNMTLLPQSDNMGQEPFAKKRKIFKDSSYIINQKIAEYESWNMDNLETHQAWLADQAKSVWHINGL